MTPPKTALITGVTGQDGAYLAEFLLKLTKQRGMDCRAALAMTAPMDCRASLAMTAPFRHREAAGRGDP